MEKKLLSGLIKASKNEHAGNINLCEVYKIPYYVDTGNLMLNCLISGDMFKGIPAGRIVQWAGSNSTGKSFMTQNNILHFIKSSDQNIALVIETEGALVREQILPHLKPEEVERFLCFPCTTVENTKNNINNLLKEIKSKKEQYKDARFLLTVDSIGMPPSEKEKTEATKEDAPKDMTRAQAIASLFRTIVMDLALLHIPANIINHQVSSMSQWEPKTEAGGEKVAYSNSMTLILKKKKLKDEKKVQVGTVFDITLKKNRVVAEGTTIEIYSKFKIGMDKYSGLWEFLKNHHLIKSVSNGSLGGSTITFPHSGEVYDTKDIAKMKPEEFWTQDKLEFINQKFKDLYLLERTKERGIDEILAEEAEQQQQKTVVKPKGKTK